jgi:hypothetical protein
MPDPDAPGQDTPPADPPKPKGPGYGDVAALGIGCLIFLIFFVAIVIAGYTRE